MKTYEYRYVNNSMWYSEASDVSANFEVKDVTEREDGYEVVVSCTAYSNTGGELRESGTGKRP